MILILWKLYFCGNSTFSLVFIASFRTIQSFFFKKRKKIALDKGNRLISLFEEAIYCFFCGGVGYEEYKSGEIGLGKGCISKIVQTYKLDLE